jgi:hypothetical protein
MQLRSLTCGSASSDTKPIDLGGYLTTKIYPQLHLFCA